jgi:hypothetical protein
VTHDRAVALVREFTDKGKVVASHHHCNMCNIGSTFETSKRNICNIHLKTMKHLKHVSETLEKHLKTLENSLQNICNIQIKTLATYV